MYSKAAALVPLLATAATSALVHIYNATATDSDIVHQPLIIWHGLGDSFDSDGMKGVADLYRDIYPGAPVLAVHLANDGDGDRQGSFFGNLNDQISAVCDDLGNEMSLRPYFHINVVGFSQGGVFARGLVERCNEYVPPFRNLVTFGSPHSGIDTFATCAEDDWWCHTWSGTLKSNTWNGWVQTNLIPAQYFRDASDVDSFLQHSNYLADINNERNDKNATYVERMSQLYRFVMVRFKDEDVVKPPVSTWFGDVNPENGRPRPLGERKLYQEEWLGLKELDADGGLIFREIDGQHMQFSEGAMENVFRESFDMYRDDQHHTDTVEPVKPVEAVKAVDGDGRSSWWKPPMDVFQQVVWPGEEIDMVEDGDDFMGYPTEEYLEAFPQARGSCTPSEKWQKEFNRLNSPWTKSKRFLQEYYDQLAGTFE